jgi:hypothetical protein
MAVNPNESAPQRSFVRVARTRGGEHTWAITVVAVDDTVAALREAVVLAKQVDKELTISFTWGEDNPFVDEAPRRTTP